MAMMPPAGRRTQEVMTAGAAPGVPAAALHWGAARPEVPMPEIVIRGAVVLFVTCLGLHGQEPATPAPTLRERLDVLCRGPGPRPQQLEWNGSIVRVDDLKRSSEAAHGDPDLGIQHQLILSALHDELQREHLILDEPRLDVDLAAYHEPYDKTPFTVQVIATKFKGYPSLDAFEQRWRIAHQFEVGIAKEIDHETLQAEADAQREFLLDGRVAVELWFYSARDDKKGCCDFAAAAARARAGLQDLQNGKDPEVVRKQGDAISAVFDPAKFYPRNQLRMIMGESEYTDLVLGCAAADTVFHAATGRLIGPLRGTQGCWLARVDKRVAAKARYEVKDERREKLVREVYLQRRFLEWADAALVKVVLRVPQKK
jgi:hypothetical protein